jgi:hypothetical protein
MGNAFNAFTALLKTWKQDPRILAVLGLGSLARPQRMDSYSDLDFFLLVETPFKPDFLSNLSWLPLGEKGYCFQNTNDGFKALITGDIFVECAVFTLDELPSISYDRPTIYYLKDPSIQSKIPMKIKTIEPLNPVYYLEECISQLLIGLQRWHRKETFAAFTMIQVVAVESFLKATLPPWPSSIDPDPYVYARRIEQAYPESESLLSLLVLGYDHTFQSAKTLYALLKKHVIHHPLYDQIESLLK